MCSFPRGSLIPSRLESGQRLKIFMNKWLRETFGLYFAYMRAGLWTVPAAFLYSISVNLFHANQRLMLIGIMPLGLYMAHCGFRNRVPDWLFNRWTHARAWYEEHFTKYGSGGC